MPGGINSKFINRAEALWQEDQGGFKLATATERVQGQPEKLTLCLPPSTSF